MATYEELKQRVRRKGRDGSAAQPAGRYEALKARVRSGDYARELAADPAMRTGVVRPHATPVGPRKSQMAFADDWFGRGYGLLTQAGDGSYKEYEARRDAIDRLMAEYDVAARNVSRNRDAYADGGGAYKALTEVHDALLEQQEYYNAFSDEETYNLARQSAQKQERAAREREAFIGPDSEGAHAFGEAWPRYVELSQKEALTKAEKKEAKAALKDMLAEYPNMENAASLKYPEEMRLLYSRLKTKSDWRYGFSAGLVDALGIDWMADKLSAAGAKLSGQEPLKQSSQAWTQEVKASDKWASGAGGVAGNLLLLSGAGKAASAASGAVPGLSKAAPAVQNMVRSGLTFGLTGAYQAAANTHTKGEWDALEKEKQAYYAMQGIRYEPIEYSAWKPVADVLKQAGISAVGGAAGSAAGAVVGDLGKAFLVKHGLQTPFAEALRQTLAGTAFAAGNTASTYFLYPEGNRPSKERMAQDLAVAFLFSALSSTINTWRTTGANKAFLDDAVKKQRQAYENMGRKGMSVTESLAAMDDILANNQKIRAVVSENYYAGQQRFVDEMLRDLAAIDEQINIIKNGIAGGGQATAGAAGGVNLAPFSPNGPPATQPTPPGGVGLMPGGALSVQPAAAPPGPVEANAYPAILAKALALAPETEAHQLAAAMVSGTAVPTEERLGALQRALEKAGQPTPPQPSGLREGAGNTPTAGMEAARSARAQGQASSAAAPLDTYGTGKPGTMLGQTGRAGVRPPMGAVAAPGASSAPYTPPAGRAGADVIQGARPPMHTVATAAKATLDSGAEVEVKGVAAVEDAGLFLRLADGETAPVEAVDFDDPALDKLYTAAALFDTGAAKAFVSGYDGSLAVGSYYNGFASIYGGARTGKTLEQAVSGSIYGQMLPPHIQQLAYFAGQNAGKLTDARLPAAAQAGRAAESPLRENAPPATMTIEDEGAIRAYKSGSAAYVLNEKLYSGAALDENDKTLIKRLDAALAKLPDYKGTTYRVLCFDRQGKEAYEAFLKRHKPGMPVFYGAYTSASKTADTYDIDGTLKVRIEIEGITGKDISAGFGLEIEQEVLYGRTVEYSTLAVETGEDGNPYIKIKELESNAGSGGSAGKDLDGNPHGAGISNTSERGTAVRNVQEHDSIHTDLQSLPGRDTKENTPWSDRPQPALRGGQRDTVRPGGPGRPRISTLRGGAGNLGGGPKAEKEANLDDKSILAGREEPVDGANQGHNAAMRDVQEAQRAERRGQAGVRSISQRDTQGSILGQSGSLQGALSGGQRDSGRESVNFRSAEDGIPYNEAGEERAARESAMPGPVYATQENRAPVQPVDLDARNRQMKAAAKRYGLSNDESFTLDAYARGLAYLFNEKLLHGGLAAAERKQVDVLASALARLPAFAGRTYRNLAFGRPNQPPTAYEDFLAEYAVGKTVTLRAFTSSSKNPNGYPLFHEKTVHLVIDGVSGRDIADTFGVPGQQEVVYLPGTKLGVHHVTTANDGHPLIFAQEAAPYDGGRNHEDRGSKEGNASDRNFQGAVVERDVRSDETIRGAAPGEHRRNDLLPQRGTGGHARGPLGGGNKRQAGALRSGIGGPATKGKDFLRAEDAAAGNWRAQRIGAADKKPMTVSDIIGKMRHDFGLSVAKGRMPRRNIQGQYDKHAHSIKTRIANDLPTVAHELGHHLDNLYGVTEGMDKGCRAELVDRLSDEMRGAYPPGKLKTEGFAEYVRKYLQNRETAKLDYPLFSAYLETALPPKDLALVNAFADEVNAYYSLDADTAQSSIRLMEEGPQDFRTPGEKAGEAYHKAYQAWVDRFHGIRLFDRAAGSNTYMRAINSAYADAVAYAVLTGDLTDSGGQRVGDGLAKALEGIKLKDKKEYLAFGEYLIVRHGPERLAEGKRVFPDDRKNSTTWMNRRKAELERAYPAFAKAADRIYGFQRSFLQTWGVETNLVPAEAAARWAERWPCYVPFNRALEKGARAGAKRGFANQDSTIRQARGSGLDLRHPVDNIINNVVKMVTAGLRNQVMLEVADAAKAQAGLGAFLERTPEPKQKIVYNASGLKASLNQEVGQAGLAEEDADKVFGIIEGLDDYLVQFGRGKARGDVIAVLRKGKPEYWKVNDPLLLESLTNMNAKEAGAIAQAYGTVSRFITGNITGLNLVWAVGSNIVRDLGTLLTYSQDKNLVHLFTGIGKAYLNALRKPDKQDPIFKEYRAVGGGSESAYTADKNMVRNVKAKLAGSQKHWLNPLEWIEAASDIIESGPRFATYKTMRKLGFTPQEAAYAAHDITVNFRRGGSMSRQLNNFVPFFNAGVQGVDKLLRWISAEDAPKAGRVKAVRSRVCQYIAAFGLLGFLQWFINSRDEEDKKYYAQLSAYTKNNFWCLPIYEGGKHTGEYLTIPKPRELAIPASLVSALLEQNASGNGEAFHEFDNYALGAYLPNLADDAVKALLDVARGDLGAAGEDLYGALGSLGLVGVFAYSYANRDFLGKPIESASFADVEPKDRFTGRTSKAAYAIGQAFNISPIIVDYFLQNTLGGFWKAQKALFPVDAQSADPSLGIAGTYVRDSQYSTDVVNALYEGKQAALQAKNSDPADTTKAIRYREADSLATFYSRYNALAKGDAESPESKAVRQVVLDMIAEFNKSAGNGYRSETQAKIDAICAKIGDTSLMCAPMQPFILDEEKARHDLTAAQYVEFQGTYNSLYWQYVGAALNVSHAFATDEIAVRQANARAIREAKTLMLSRLGVESGYAESLAREKDVGLTAQDDILFQAALEAASGDGALHKQEVYGLLEGMDWLDDRQREYLFGSQAAYSGASNIYKTTSQLNDWINGQRKEGRDDSSITRSITSVYKPLYKEYYLSGDQAGLREIEGKLLRLDLRGKDGAAYYTLEMLEGWIVD